MNAPRTDRAALRRALLVAAPFTGAALWIGSAKASAGEAGVGTWALVVAAMVVAFFGSAPDDGANAPRSRYWTFGALSIALSTSALQGPGDRSGWAALIRDVVLAVGTVFATRAVGEIEGDIGLAAKAANATSPREWGPKTAARAATVAAIFAWTVATFADALVTFGSRISADAAAGTSAAAAGIATGIVGVAALVVAGQRRLELTAPPRALACVVAVALGLLLAIGLAIKGTNAETAAALGCAFASLGVVRLSRVRDVLTLARRGRRLVTLALFGGPIVILVATVASGAGSSAPVAALVLAVVAMFVGAIGGKLEEPFLPSRGILLEALEEARDATNDRDTRNAISHALTKLRRAAQDRSSGVPASPELWMLHPTRICTVDSAGYLREREAELPLGIFDVAAAEPHATIRTSVLDALEVRRADLRPLLRWLDSRDAMCATLITEGAEPDGLLVIPRGARSEEMSLEEVRAVKRLADAFVSICVTTSARERHLERERELKARIEALEDDIAQREHVTALDVGRNVLATTRLARPATVGIYSAASRMAYDALERRVSSGAPIVLVAPPGIDPVPYIARAHLGGPRREGPLVVVDGTSSREHDEARWRDERVSPIALADRGLLVLVDGAALPRDIQMLIARTLTERRPPWERASALDIAIALTGVTHPSVLAEEGRLATELFGRFEDSPPIELPGLRERAEDLRSIVADRLAREGLRVLGRPVGIDPAAFARLVEYPFEGEEAELASIVSRLVKRVSADIVRAADVDALRLELGDLGEDAADEPATSGPSYRRS